MKMKTGRFLSVNSLFLMCALVYFVSFPAAAGDDVKIDYLCEHEHPDSGYVVDAILQDKSFKTACPTSRVKRVKSVEAMATLSIEVCSTSPIPSGWVIVSTIAGAPNCPGPDGYLAYRIENSKNLKQRDVCKISSIPAGWVVTGRKTGNANCYTPQLVTRYQSYEIRNPAGLSEVMVCKVSPIPSGWVVTQTSNYHQPCYIYGGSDNSPNYKILNLN